MGIIIAIVIWNMDIANISTNGQRALSITLMTVIFWATKITNVGFISILYLLSLILLNVAPASDVLYFWISPILYLVIGAYLIADAVNRSGLGERIAYLFILKFVNSYKSIIVSIFVLQIILSLLIPHPWPRAFLVLSVMQVVIKSAQIRKENAAIIGFTVFAAAIPTSMLFLTGDSTINMIVMDFAGEKLGWLDWFYYMGIPAIAASIFTCMLIFIIFRPAPTVNIEKKVIKEKLANLGELTSLEKRTIFWVSIAIVLWMTDSLHNIDLGWVTILIAILMSMPIIGGVITQDSLKTIPIDTLFFLNAALVIGKIGEMTGMNFWIVSSILPSSPPENIFIFGLLVVAISILLHMLLGSVMAVMGVAIPAFIAYASSSLLNPLVPALLVYASVAFHYILPYQHITILVGMGEDYGLYNDFHIIKMGIPLTLVVFLTVLLVQIPWMHVTGLL